MSEHTPGPWYSAGTGNHQGLVIDEPTGHNIAVTYDKADAAIVAAAPDLLQALKQVEARLTNVARAFYVDGKQKALQAAFDGWKADAAIARDIIAKAEGRN